VKTKDVIDREVDELFNVPVIVTDNGQPRMSSTLTFKVMVSDINDNDPQPRYARLFLSLFEGVVPTVPVASVRPLDDDIFGSYSCEFEGTNPTAVFGIQPNSCDLMIKSFPIESSYTLHVRGDDGSVNPVTYDIDVKVMLFDNNSVTHSTILQIADVTADHFMEAKYVNFLRAVGQAFSTQDTVKLLGFTQHATGDLLLHLVVKNFADDEYYSQEVLRDTLAARKSEIEKESVVFIVDVAYSSCGTNYCQNGGSCASQVNVQSSRFVADSDFRIFSNPSLTLSTYCKCPPEYTGPDCSQQATPCGNIYCHNGGTCNNQQCQCTAAWIGSSCEQDVNECVRDVCQNGATCENTPGDYVCHCRDGYFGKTCQEGDNYCQSNPCQYGTCENLVNTFQCRCNYGYFGRTCQLSSTGFHESSYLEFPTLTTLSNIEVTFATEKQNSLLMYNPSSRSNNFVALEIVNGRVQFSVSLGTGEITRLSVAKSVNTGQWFKANVARNTEV